ncbi:MAG: O-antigen ligase family protein [Firmicutes bacterium]|nr:O-antigen ligase family protein [Bacillota bacterium]
MAKKTKDVKKENKGFKSDIVILLPILFILTLFLFCVRGSIVETHLSEMFWFAGGEYAGDLYAYFRMMAFVIVTIVFGVYMLFGILMGEIKINKNKVYIPMIIYSIFVVISFAASEYKDIALLGAIERYEGTIALLCYMAILFYTMHAVKDESAVKLAVKCFAIACAVLGLWGILQFFGMKLDSLPEWLYLSSKMREVANIEEKMVTSAVTLFFSNQNYSSFFLGLPVCVFGMASVASEDNKNKILYAALTGVMMFCLWQAASLGGMVGIAVSAVVALAIAGVENIKKWKKSIGLIILAGIISIGASMPVIMKEIKSGADSTVGSILGFEKVYAAEESKTLKFVKIDHVITDGKDIVFSFAGNEVRIETENGGVKSVTDSTGAKVTEDRRLLRVTESIDEATGYNVINVRTYKCDWKFTVFNGEAFFFAPTGQGIKLDKVESIGFENNQRFATNRGYIWSRTLPLLKGTLLFGKGADTFAVFFPQDDYAGRYNIGYFRDGSDIIIDKPHNMYLGAAVNTGVISMIALVAIYIIYIIESIKVYRKHEYTGFKDYIGMGIFVAVCGFMVAGLVNDSTVQMMPVVYVLLGLGFAINTMIKKEKTEK